MEVVWVEGVGDEAGVWRPLASHRWRPSRGAGPAVTGEYAPLRRCPFPPSPPHTNYTHTLAVGGLADCVCDFPGVSGRGGGVCVCGGGNPDC